MNTLFDDKPDLKSDFESYWDVVPRKVSKKDAYKAYSRARVRNSAEFLKNAMLAYAQSRVGQDPKFSLHPATWLNAERWNDQDPATPSATTTPADVTAKKEREYQDKVFVAKMCLFSARHAPNVYDLREMVQRGDLTEEQAKKWPMMR